MTGQVTVDARAPRSREAFLAAVRAEASPVRGAVAAQDLRAVVASVVFTLGVFFAAGGPHTSARPANLIVGTVVAWSSIAAVATALALRRGRAMLGMPRPWLLAGSFAVPVSLAIAWFGRASPLVVESVAHGFGLDAQCCAVTIALGVGPLFAFFALRREGDPIAPAVTGAILGAAAGAWGSVLIDLHCEFADPRHVVLGHLLPVALLTLVGALGARSLLAIRPAALPSTPTK